MRMAERKRRKGAPRAQIRVMATRACWCGSSDFAPFGPEYGECRACGTLVYLKDTPPEELLVRDDETDYYGKKYWLERQADAFGHPDIHNRARKDLPERNLHWLRALLKYRLPPAKVLELGCAHGSFVALMRQAGYQASGIDLSPWVVAFSQQLFGIPVHAGPIESLDMPDASLDVIVLMDVLEHLPDPAATLRRCLKLLKPQGVLLVQTPCLREGASHEVLVESKDRFLEMLIPIEHIYLFSQRSVTEFFRRLGAEHIAFEPAIFEHYDMFFAVSRSPLIAHATEEIESALMATPNGRLALALLDLRDSAAQQVKTLTGWVEEARAEAAQLREYQASAEPQIHALNRWVEEARTEAAQLREQGSSAVQQIKTLRGWVEEARANAAAAREELVKQIETLTGWVHEAREANARLQKAKEEQHTALVMQIDTLTGWVHEARENNARLQKAKEEQHIALVKQIDTLTGWVHEAREANATLKQDEMEEQKRAHAAQLVELGSLNKNLQSAMEEQKRAHSMQMAEFNNLRMSAVKQIETLTGWVHEAREANAALQKAMEEQKDVQAGEVGALQDQLARPLVKLALSLSSIGGRPGTRGGDRR
jgi:2-polyprenyl-3-methyl-5-hydroxy-6-metoxy-1,4-benzoquinol methylase